MGYLHGFRLEDILVLGLLILEVLEDPGAAQRYRIRGCLLHDFGFI